jgi:flagellar hook-basal body complex protein FliE
MVNFNANVSGTQNLTKDLWKDNAIRPGNGNDSNGTPKVGSSGDKGEDFANAVKAVENYINNVDNLQQSSDMSIMDLLSGKNEDITSVVSAVAKADMSFKLLVGVRNKLIEAYKQTMNMPL